MPDKSKSKARGETGLLDSKIIAMKDEAKTKEQPIEDLAALRDRRTGEAIEHYDDTGTAINALLHLSLEDYSLEELLQKALDIILSVPSLSIEAKGCIFLVEDEPEVLIQKVQKGLAEPLLKECARVPFGKCLCGRAASTKRIEFADHIDERHEVSYEGIAPHGHYCVPILLSGNTIGVINLYLKDGHNCIGREEEFLDSVANTLAGIIKRRRAEEEQRLHQETAERLAKETVLIAEIGRIISSTVNIEEVYERFAEEVRKLIPFDRIVINSINIEKNMATNLYVMGASVSNREIGVNYPLQGSASFEMVRLKSSLLFQTEDFTSEYRDRFPGLWSTFQAGFRSIMNIPLFLKGKIIGGLLLRSLTPNAYVDYDVRLAERVGNQIAGAIANSQLFADLKKTEMSLRESEGRYRATLEKIQEGYYEVDLAGNFTFFNPAMSKMLGYTDEEMMGMSYRLYTDEDTVGAVFRAFNEVYETGLSLRIDYEQIKKDESRMFVETSIALMHDPFGQPHGFRGVVRNITERKLAVDALQKSEEESKRLAKEMAIIAEIGRLIGSTLDIDEVYERAAAEARKLIPFDSLIVNLKKPQEDTLVVAYASGADISERRKGDLFPLKGSVSEIAMRTRIGLIVRSADILKKSDRFATLGVNLQAGLHSMMGAPLISRDEAIGALVFRAGKPNAYMEQDLRLAEKIGAQIAGAIVNAQLFAELKKTETSLRESEGRYRAIVERAAVGVAEVEMGTGRFLTVNRWLCELVGRTEEELLATTFLEITHPDDRHVHENKMMQLASGEISDYGLEKRYIRKDGTTIWVNLAISPLWKPGEAPTRNLIVVQNIDERKRAEEALKLSELNHRTLFESSRDAIMTLTPPSWRFTSGNPATIEMFEACNEAAFRALGPWDLAPEFQADGRPSSEKAVEMIQTAMAKGSHYFEWIHRRLGGELFPATILLTRMEIGGQALLQATVRDISESKRTEAELLTAHAKMALLINSISSILIAVSEDNRIVFWNTEAEKQFGIPEKEVLEKPINALGIQWDWDQIMDGIARCRKENSGVGLDNVKFLQLTGKEGILGLRFTPTFGEKSVGMVTLIQGANITRRKIMENQLIQAQKLESIGQLAAGIAHEINTPTQYIGDNVRFLQTSCEALKKVLMKYEALTERIREGKGCDDLLGEVEEMVQEADLGYLTEEIPRAFQQTLEGVERVSRIVQSMKAFAHPGTEEKIPVDINKAIENTMMVARNEWKYVADLVTDFDPSLPLVSCVPGDINQVVLNVLVNAAQAVSEAVNGGSGGKGKISISTSQDDSWVEIRISDTGNGIPVGIRQRIFDPFFTTKEVGKGSGQGLAISHTAIVERHHGSIAFDTEIGQGTTFIIRLPIKEPINAGN